MTETPSRGWSSSASATADVVLLRHGATRLTPDKRFSGTGAADPALSPAGRDQAARAAASSLLRSAAFADVLCSPMTRCRQTAEIVADQLGLEVRVEPDLSEMDFGRWEGMTFAEVQDRYPEDLRRWQLSPGAAPTGSIETFTAVFDRMSRLARSLAVRYAGTAVIAVSHVTPIKALIAQAVGAPPAAMFRIELSAAAFSRIAYSGQEASVTLVNDASHLV
ncbi:MAG TPA: histidine phosphatase family protein [Microlunatus sp.]